MKQSHSCLLKTGQQSSALPKHSQLTLIGCVSFTAALFPRYTAFSSRPEDAHEMYSGGSVVGEPTIIYPEISPTLPLIFTRYQIVRNLASFSTPLVFQRPAFENAARCMNSETNTVSIDDGPVTSRSLVKFGPRYPENLSLF